MATRVCFKNVPFDTSQQLRDFILDRKKEWKVSQITDCRVLKGKSGQSRKVAFVGFVSTDLAQECVHYFHKSYCRTSKLIVEFAVLPKKQKGSSDEAKQPAVEEKPEAPKQKSAKELQKEEFLAVMTKQKDKFWSDDVAPAVEPVMEDDDSDEGSDVNDIPPADDDSDDDDADPLQGKTTKSTSDLDFLRSKQVQKDDLDEDASDSSSSTSSSSIEDDDEDVEMAAPAPTEQIPESSPAEEQQPASVESLSAASNRLFLRNLPFSATEEDIRDHFQDYGPILECHIPVDDQKRPKGFCFLTLASRARAALDALDGTDFQGRLLHILPAREAPRQEHEETGGTYKEQQERDRQKKAASDSKGWSASFVRGDAVVDNLATRLGLRKGDILDVKDGLSAGDAAVRLALGETAIIEENRKYFSEHGIDMEALVGFSGPENPQRSKSSVLVKNLPADTTYEELLQVFAKAGDAPKRILLPPSRTIAVVEYGHANDAKSCFRKLAYKRFKTVPLYLEWAPLASTVAVKDPEEPVQEELPDQAEEELQMGPTASIHVSNLNFSTTDAELEEFFSQHASDVRSVRIVKKVAAQKSGEDLRELSMGYGFVEFGSRESAERVLRKLQGTLLGGHALKLQPSKQQAKTTSISSKTKETKLMVRNIPFQANRKELLQLFGSFGQLKKVRLPKKFDGSHRGFCFVEYTSHKEAGAAMQALSRTHLYGRHLVIEWAAADDKVEAMDHLRDKARRDTEDRPNKKIRFD